MFDGPNNGESFLFYVQHILVPTLKLGHIVTMDRGVGNERICHVSNSERFAAPSQTNVTSALHKIGATFRGGEPINLAAFRFMT